MAILCIYFNRINEPNQGVLREFLESNIIFSVRHLCRVLKNYFEYNNRFRVHQSLDMARSTEGRLRPSKTVT